MQFGAISSQFSGFYSGAFSIRISDPITFIAHNGFKLRLHRLYIDQMLDYNCNLNFAQQLNNVQLNFEPTLNISEQINRLLLKRYSYDIYINIQLLDDS